MILFDRTQPIDIRPRHDFGRGFIVRPVRANTFEQITPFDEHVRYVTSEHIEYESTLGAEYAKQRVRP